MRINGTADLLIGKRELRDFYVVLLLCALMLHSMIIVISTTFLTPCIMIRLQNLLDKKKNTFINQWNVLNFSTGAAVLYKLGDVVASKKMSEELLQSMEDSLDIDDFFEGVLHVST